MGIASLLMFGSYISTRKAIVGDLALMFFLVGAHAYVFALPILLTPDNPALIQSGFLVGTAFIFLIFLIGLDVERFMTRSFLSDRRIDFLSVGLGLLAGLTIYLVFSRPQPPVIDPSGIVFWNLYPLASWLVGLSSLFYGALWGMVFYRGAFLVDDLQSRFKLLVISIDGFVLGAITLLVFVSQSKLLTLVTHFIFVAIGILTLGIYLIPKKFFILRNKP